MNFHQIVIPTQCVVNLSKIMKLNNLTQEMN